MPALFIDLFLWIMKNRGGIYYFYLLKLQQKGNKTGSYLTVNEYSKVHEKLDSVYKRPLLEDKLIFDRYIKSFSIPSPDLLAIIENGSIFWMDNHTSKPLHSLLDHPMHAFCKKATSWGGKNIYKIDVDNKTLLVNDKPSSPAELASRMETGKYILQQTIVQQPRLDEVNSSCVNTLRVYTVSDGKEGHFFSCFFRMGANHSIVDNVSANNLVTGVRNDHSLLNEALTWTYPPKWYDRHPDSKITFADFKLPFYSESIELCCNAHKYFDDFFIIAWDVAILENGPMLLEGNPAPDLTLVQALYGGIKEEFLKAANTYRVAKKMGPLEI